MKWKKLGKIFDPAAHALPYGGEGFSQSPQTLVFDDFVRVYFSTRSKDETGKFLSHIAFADFDKDFKRVIKVSDHSVIPLGTLGCFDEHGIFPINVVKAKDKILAYTTGWNRKVSVSADASIGLAISNDGGSTFTKYGDGPIMTSSLHEPFLVCDAFVAIFNDIYIMWYIYGSRWITDVSEAEPQRVYKIACATSADGITWERDGKHIVPNVLNEDECQALPSVIYHKNRYHMVFCYREATGFRNVKGRGYKLGYAYSDDLKVWTRDDASLGIEFPGNEWDSDMQCYPHFFHCDGRVYLMYNGNEFGREGFGLALLED